MFWSGNGVCGFILSLPRQTADMLTKNLHCYVNLWRVGSGRRSHTHHVIGGYLLYFIKQLCRYCQVVNHAVCIAGCGCCVVISCCVFLLFISLLKNFQITVKNQMLQFLRTA